MASTLPRPSGSPWEESLLRHLTEHAEQERHLIDAYGELAQAGPEHVRYLVGLIVGDETRHHSVLEEMANSILGEIEFRDFRPFPSWMGGSEDRNQAAS